MVLLIYTARIAYCWLVNKGLHLLWINIQRVHHCEKGVSRYRMNGIVRRLLFYHK